MSVEKYPSLKIKIPLNKSVNDRTTCPTIQGFVRSIPNSDRTLSVVICSPAHTHFLSYLNIRQTGISGCDVNLFSQIYVVNGTSLKRYYAWNIRTTPFEFNISFSDVHTCDDIHRFIWRPTVQNLWWCFLGYFFSWGRSFTWSISSVNFSKPIGRVNSSDRLPSSYKVYSIWCPTQVNVIDEVTIFRHSGVAV